MVHHIYPNLFLVYLELFSFVSLGLSCVGRSKYFKIIDNLASYLSISSNSLILKEDQGKISKSELSFDYLIDGRDSIIKPKNGFLLRSDITISGLGSRNSYIKGSARGKIYNSKSVQ